jgi:UDP-glucose:(heptosyl)LPS alpha-1,3-glucosyltransferase
VKLAFCLFNYFPYGGLQRDFLRIAKTCVQRGHSVDVFTMRWEGAQDPALSIHLVPTTGWQNHTRCQQFVKNLQPLLAAGNYAHIVGFNKMPGLDIYYAADTCYQAKARAQHGAYFRLTPRYRHLVAYEEAVFSPQAKTEILLLSAAQQPEFSRYYHTQPQRFHFLPPGISKDRRATANAADIREYTRKEFAITNDELLLLMVGSGFRTKGLDRTLFALSALPTTIKERVKLFVIGDDEATTFLRQAKKLQIAEKVSFLGGRPDVPRFLLAADLLLHPAYNENTGTVLLEALVAGLPVLTTDVCGYAHYIHTAQAGVVLASPFVQEHFNQTLTDMLLSLKQTNWQSNALNFAEYADIYSLPEHAADWIEKLI